jgi:hypothetical protein
VIALLVLAAITRRGGPFYLAIGAMVGSVAAGVGRARAGIDLHPDHAVVRGLVGSTPIPWSALESVEVTERMGHRSVVLQTADTAHRLVAPSTSRVLPDPDFDAKVDEIGAAWHTAIR